MTEIDRMRVAAVRHLEAAGYRPLQHLVQRIGKSVFLRCLIPALLMILVMLLAGLPI